MMRKNLKMKTLISSDSDEETKNSDDYKSDDSKQEDMYDEMDPDAITSLSDPTTLQDDEDSEESSDEHQPQVKEPDKEEAGIQRRVQRGTGSQSNHCQRANHPRECLDD